MHNIFPYHENDNELLALLAKGNEAAFTEIYNRYWDKLFTVAANKLSNLFEAEEIVQDIFLDLWKRRKDIKVTAGLSAYLATAVKYKVINTLAKRNQQQRYSKHSLHTISNADSSTEQWLNFSELQDRLHTLVAALPEKCRLVFELSRTDGLSQKDIASQLGISEKTVEAHISKAIKTLRTAIKSSILLPF